MALDSQRLASEACSRLGRLRLRTGRDGRTQVVRLIGELDLATVAGLKRELRCVERAEPAVIAIDLSELTFIASAGIAAILKASQRSSERGYRLIVVSGNPVVQRAFDVCGLTDNLPFVGALPVDAGGRSTVTTSRRRKRPTAAPAHACRRKAPQRRGGTCRCRPRTAHPSACTYLRHRTMAHRTAATTNGCLSA